MTGRWTAAVVVTMGLAGCGGGEAPAETADGGTSTIAAAGETTYQRFCFSCHAAGVAGAPKMGDAAAWAARLEKGEEALVAATINGVPPGMPPRGMCLQCSDEDLRAAVQYMVERSR